MQLIPVFWEVAVLTVPYIEPQGRGSFWNAQNLAAVRSGALQTAEIINKYHNLKMNYDERLIDASRGVFQGTLRMQTEFEDYFKNPKRFNGETKEETYKKIKSFVNDLNIYKGKNILIVGHSGILEYIKYCVKNQIITNETKLNINTNNCEIIKIEF